MSFPVIPIKMKNLKTGGAFQKNQKKFFPIAEQTIDARGEAREEARTLYDKIISGNIFLVKRTKIMFEEYKKTRTVKKKVHSKAKIFINWLIHFPLRFIYRPRIIGGYFYVELPVA
jgi:hypothetical protein